MNARSFEAKPAVRDEEPLLLGIVGPPGGGKSLSALLLAKGMQTVRDGHIIVLDTEGGRSKKYAGNIQLPSGRTVDMAFDIVEMPEGSRSEDYLAAIKAQLPSNAAAIVVDSMSDEHVEYLAWHDEMVPKMGGNEWAAWSKPAAARKKLINGILKIKTPLIFTFRAREKTKQEGKKVINIGWQPVAPLEIVHTLDLTCILPPRADGVPVWQSDKIGEDFIIKLPNYLAPFIEKGRALDEQMGAAFARWAKGDTPNTDSAAHSRATPAADQGGEVGGPPGANLAPDDLLAQATEAAKHGMPAYRTFWANCEPHEQRALKADHERLKTMAQEADLQMEATDARALDDAGAR